MSPTTTIYPTYYGPHCPQGPPQAQGGYPSVATTCTQGPPCHPVGPTGYLGCGHPTTVHTLHTAATVCTQLGAGCPPAVTQHCGVTQVPGQQTAYCGTGPVAPAAPMVGMHTAATVCTQLGAGCPPPHTWTTTVGQQPQHQNTAATLCTQAPACPQLGPAVAGTVQPTTFFTLPPTTNFCITMHCPPPAAAAADTVGPPVHLSHPPYCPGGNTGAVPPAGGGVYNPPATAIPHCLPGGQTGVRIPSIPPDCPAGQASPNAAQPLLSAPPHCPTVQACHTLPMQCITTVAAAAPAANVSVPPHCPTVPPQCYGPTQWPHCYSPAGQAPAGQPLLSAPPHCPTVQACHTVPPQCPHLLSAPPHCPEAPAQAQGGFSVPPHCPTVPPQCYGPTQWPQCPPPAGAQAGGSPAEAGQPLASAATHCPTVPPMCQPTWNCQLPPASVPPMCPVTIPA